MLASATPGPGENPPPSVRSLSATRTTPPVRAATPPATGTKRAAVVAGSSKCRRVMVSMRLHGSYPPVAVLLSRSTCWGGCPPLWGRCARVRVRRCRCSCRTARKGQRPRRDGRRPGSTLPCEDERVHVERGSGGRNSRRWCCQDRARRVLVGFVAYDTARPLSCPDQR
jgi:hypothetical protein